MARRKKKQQRAELPSPVRTPRAAWVLRLLAAVVFLLGVVPMANFVTTGVGLPWLSDVAVQWLMWGGSVVVVAMVLGRLASERIESFGVTALRVLNAPSPALFAGMVGAAAAL